MYLVPRPTLPIQNYLHYHQDQLYLSKSTSTTTKTNSTCPKLPPLPPPSPPLPSPPQANAKQAEEEITNVVNKQQTKSPDGVVLITGDFNQSTLSSSLPTFHQYITCLIRKNKTIDLCYGNAKEGYKSTALPPLGSSDHCMVQLTPKYRPILKTNKPRKFKVTTRTVDNIEALRGCFASTEWTVFQETCDNLAELNDIITSYITFCEGAHSEDNRLNKDDYNNHTASLTGTAALFRVTATGRDVLCNGKIHTQVSGRARQSLPASAGSPASICASPDWTGAARMRVGPRQANCRFSARSPPKGTGWERTSRSRDQVPACGSSAVASSRSF
ncbi:endonuclease domain of the non-LTR retrotransposon LINE-1 [Elysia marginata]|uniref:Endonuclease domain of the non-LTR retrotransposon LINE-1 n=1 Tax=Elysia marginata TaxID=1093978 RepID=A0AAV4EXN2_9GAST|nr:endonuclease domain of the non-LTR retrotransposon LINE-1 [Elysia marginata]